MRTFFLTAHLSMALLGLAAAALILFRMALNILDGATSDHLGLILLCTVLVFAAVNIARTISLVTDKDS